jgi:hypothetical protein
MKGKRAMAASNTKTPQIGIWWDDGRQVVPFTQPLGEVEPTEKICDSDLAHAEMWPEAAKYFGRTADDEYFSVPRGRVVWLVTSKKARIIHGNATRPDRLKAIAKAFNFGKWEAQSDDHYAMGDRVEELFED